MKFYSVHFNQPLFLKLQKDVLPGELIVINNGNNEKIHNECIVQNIKVFNINNVSTDPSVSHGNALNYLKTIIDYTDDYCILDHDFFVYKELDFKGNDIMSVKHQQHGYYWQLWPGFIACKKHVDISDINFLPNQYGDTGADTRRLIDKYKVYSYTRSNLGSKTTDYFQTSVFLEIIEDFGIHFLNGSRWMNLQDEVYYEKVKILKNFLTEKLK